MKAKTPFIVLSLLTLSLTYFHYEFIDFEKVYRLSLIDNLNLIQIDDILITQQKWQWTGYLIIPIIILIKISIIALIIDLGCFIANKKIRYKILFNLVVKAEFVFLLVIVFKTLWFVLFQTSYTLEDLQYFYPLSAINITGYNDLQPWFVYPLQVLNIFEIAYWLILAYLIGKELKISPEKGLGIIASSYGVGLVIWVVAIMFFTLNVS